MAQWLRAPTELPGDPTLVPSRYSQLSVTTMDPMTSFGPDRHPHTYGIHSYLNYLKIKIDIGKSQYPIHSMYSINGC
jgi:hypothetical protein